MNDQEGRLRRVTILAHMDMSLLVRDDNCGLWQQWILRHSRGDQNARVARIDAPDEQDADDSYEYRQGSIDLRASHPIEPFLSD